MPAPEALIARLAVGEPSDVVQLAGQSGLTEHQRNLLFFFQQLSDGDGQWLAQLAHVLGRPSANYRLATELDSLGGPEEETRGLPTDGVMVADGEFAEAGSERETALLGTGEALAGDGEVSPSSSRAEALLSKTSRALMTGKATEGESWPGPTPAQGLVTRFGGIFVLLPSMLELEALAGALPELDGEGIDGAAMVRYLLAIQCFGAFRARDAAADPVLSLAVGLDQAPPLDSLQALSQATTTTMVDACQARLAERLVHLRRAEGRCLSAELVPTPEDEDQVLLLRDVAQDAWVYAAPVGAVGAEIGDTLEDGLAMVRTAAATPLEGLLIGPSLGERLSGAPRSDSRLNRMWLAESQPPGLLRLELGDPGAQGTTTVWTPQPERIPDALQAEVAQYLTRAKPAAEELNYLSLADHGSHLVDDRHLDLTWSLVANAVLKGFARRLLGFHWSSAGYLYHNFLEGTSTVQIEGGRIEVQLPLCPLHVLLRLAGLDGQSYTVPWLNDAQVTLALPAG